MVFVGRGPIVQELDARAWRLVEPLHYRGASQEFTVPAGFNTDFASVPRALVWLIPRYGAYTRAAILHDYLLKYNQVSVVDADGIFRRSLKELGVSIPRRWMMWAGVRVANRLRGATAPALAIFSIIAILSVLFLAIPVLAVTLFLLLFWLVELAFWAVTRLGQRTNAGPPKPEMKT